MKRGVLLPVLIQDPVVAGETEGRSIIHPVIVRDPVGFTEGPACRRVAVVDLDFNTGELRRPARFDRRPSLYYEFGKNDTPWHLKRPSQAGKTS
jgi:hypothetical protein